MAIEPFVRPVVVPVANPASARPLLSIAARLIGEEGSIVAVTVLREGAPSDEHAHAWQGLADAEEAAADLGVRTRGRVIEASQISDGVLATVAEHDAGLVLMGWRGTSSTSDVFGRLIDSVVGRSSVPLAIVRLGVGATDRVVLPIGADHLLPGGEGGLGLAARLAELLSVGTSEPTTVLRTGPAEQQLPARLARLGDRVHHDPRRTDQAVAAFARPEDLVVAAVAPTVSGLRAATTHLAWAAPDATLLVAVDVGPTRETDESLVDAVGAAGQPAPHSPGGDAMGPVRVVVTARLPETGRVSPDDLERVLRAAGTTDQLMAWWPADDPRPHVRVTVTVRASTVNAAMAAVMVAVHDADDFRGAEVTYDAEADLDLDQDPDPQREVTTSREAARRTTTAASRPSAASE